MHRLRLMMRPGQKGYIPRYGWFGKMGPMVNPPPSARRIPLHRPEHGDLVWFWPAHSCGSGVQVLYQDIEPYEWEETWVLFWRAHGHAV